MGMTLLEVHDSLQKRRTHGAFDEFFNYTNGSLWTSFNADANATVAAQDSDGGILKLSTGDAVDNNEVMVRSTKKCWTPTSNHPIMAEARLNYTEANTTIANIAFGISSAAGANLLQDDGAGPAANMTGALIYKVDGGTALKCISSIGTTQTISTSSTTAGGGNQTLSIEIRPTAGGITAAEVAFYCNGTQLLDSTTGKQIKHTVDFTSAVAAYFVPGYVKAGGAFTQNMTIDYAAIEQTR